jgi:hypothetical protein
MCIKVDVAEHERALVLVDGRPAAYLRPGSHRRFHAPWRRIKVRRFDTRRGDLPLTAEERRLVPHDDYLEITAPEGCVVVRLVDGEFEAVLGRGRQGCWAGGQDTTLAVVDLRTQVVNVLHAGTETLDRAKVLASLVAACKVTDVPRFLDLQPSLHEAVEGKVVEILRQEVAAIPLSHALANLTVLQAAVRSRVAEWAGSAGLELVELALLDLAVHRGVADELRLGTGS